MALEQKQHIGNSYTLDVFVDWEYRPFNTLIYRVCAFETLYERQFVCSFTHMCMCTAEVLKT